MVRDCIETLGIKNVYTSDVEFGIEGVSYTVLTLKALTDPGYIKAFLEGSGVKSKKASEDHKFYWLMGSDTLATFETWYKPGEILDMATLLVAARPGDDTDIEVCSRSIRKNLGGDIEMDDLVMVFEELFEMLFHLEFVDRGGLWKNSGFVYKFINILWGGLDTVL